MNIEDVRRRAFAMPLTNPAYPPGPHRFVDRELFIVTYRTDPDALCAVVPEPLQVAEPLVSYEFIRMPDSTGFGDYSPSLKVEKDTLVGRLAYGSVDVAIATMGYKHHALETAPIKAAIGAANFLLKIVPHVDGSARVCELVRYFCEDVTVKGAWSGPAAIELFHDALAPVARLPVREIVSGVHVVCDLTPGLGTVVHDYLG